MRAFSLSGNHYLPDQQGVRFAHKAASSSCLLTQWLCRPLQGLACSTPVCQPGSRVSKCICKPRYPTFPCPASKAKYTFAPAPEVRTSVLESAFAPALEVRTSDPESTFAPALEVRPSVPEAAFAPALEVRPSVQDSTCLGAASRPCLIQDRGVSSPRCAEGHEPSLCRGQGERPASPSLCLGPCALAVQRAHGDACVALAVLRALCPSCAEGAEAPWPPP